MRSTSSPPTAEPLPDRPTARIAQPRPSHGEPRHEQQQPEHDRRHRRHKQRALNRGHHRRPRTCEEVVSCSQTTVMSVVARVLSAHSSHRYVGSPSGPITRAQAVRRNGLRRRGGSPSSFTRQLPSPSPPRWQTRRSHPRAGDRDDRVVSLGKKQFAGAVLDGPLRTVERPALPDSYRTDAFNRHAATQVASRFAAEVVSVPVATGTH